MASVRQQILDAIVTRLGQITNGKVFTLPDGAYSCTSTPKSVTAWRKVPNSLAQVPALAVWDTDSDQGENPLAHHEHRLSVAIVGFVAGSTAATVARALLADTLAAIGSDPNWSGLARYTEIDSQTITVDQAADVTAGCEIKITIVYRTRLWRI